MLSIQDVHFGYNGAPLLGGVGLDVAPGEVVGLVGPNGSGKSTLLRLVGGVLKPQRGRILLDGQDVVVLGTAEVARRVAVVPQSPTLPPDFTVAELVLMGRTPHLRLFQRENGSDVEASRRAMAEAGIAHMAGRLVGTLSGGERQRVLIARALAQEAPLLLLDEPTASLDLVHQTAVLDLVRQAQRRRGGAVLMAIHDLTLAAQYCHRLAVLHGGRIVALGTPGDVLTMGTLRQVYGEGVCVVPHPVTGTPAVLPVGAEQMHLGEEYIVDGASTDG